MPNSAPAVSVVIPTYNQAGLLRIALEGVRAQTEADWEAVIVNNHSTDDTRAVVEGFAEPRFRLVDFANHGIIAASRNKGISLATGEWVAFLDSDDQWEPEKLSACLAAADGADLICHRERTVRDGRTLSISPLYGAADADYRQILFKRNCFSPTAVMVRRDALDRLGGFSEDAEIVTCEDYDLWLRLVASGVRVKFIEPVLSIYRLHDSNSSASALRHMNAGLAAVERHFGALQPKRAFDGARYRLRRSMIIYGAARQCIDAGRHGEARGLLLQSLKAFPLNLRALAFSLVTAFKPGHRDRSAAHG